jgi:hypothetical protein
LRPQRETKLPKYSIVIDEVSGGDIANILRGHIVIGEETVKFTGIAYGRYGGQNVAPKLSPAARKRLKPIFGDLAAFEEDLQMRLVGGEFEMGPGQGGHDHQHKH